MLSFEDWEYRYKPIKNNIGDNPSFQNEKGEGIMFETYGDELDYVLELANQVPDRVWTYIDGDDGTYVTNGYHLVNRIGYFITEVPYDDKGGTEPFLDVLVDLYEEYEEEIDE